MKKSHHQHHRIHFERTHANARTEHEGVGTDRQVAYCSGKCRRVVDVPRSAKQCPARFRGTLGNTL